MVSFSRLSALFIVGIALLLPLSISASAETVIDHGAGQYNFYSDWMSPRVEPIESKVLFVSEHAKREISPREEQAKAAAAGPVRDYGTGQYNFYSDWMSPRVEPIESKVLFVSEHAKQEISPPEEQARAAAGPVRDYGTGQYNFYSDWMSPRVEPIEERTFPFLTQGASDEEGRAVSN